MPSQPTILETERLILRPYTLADIEASYQMNLDASVSQYTGDGGVVSRAEIERRITQNVMGDYNTYGYGRWAVDIKEGEKCIGFCGLKFLPDYHAPDIGFRFKSAYWGQGFATESAKACIKYGFETLKLNKILAFVLPENIASINVLRKLNFRFEKEVLEDELIAKQYILFK